MLAAQAPSRTVWGEHLSSKCTKFTGSGNSWELAAELVELHLLRLPWVRRHDLTATWLGWAMLRGS